MDYNILLELVTNLGYELAVSGAETFRVEESIRRVTESYSVHSEVFAIPNSLIVSIVCNDGKPITSMRRIGYHGNDLNAVEHLNALSRKICSEKPDLTEAAHWLDSLRGNIPKYSLPVFLLGNFLGGAGFGILFGCGWLDMLCAGICGVLVGLINRFMDRMKANPFFSTLAASFLMSVFAHLLAQLGIAYNVDVVIIGALMMLVPGLLFTNAMRDIIFGDTNSGVNRIVQVLLIAAAIALGTAAAWNLSAWLWQTPVSLPGIRYPLPVMCFAAALGCMGFTLLFNIHGKGVLLCVIGGILTWTIYDCCVQMGGSEILGYFWGAAFGAFYSEIMARVRKFPAISYLVVALIPLIPGAGVYYSMNYAVRGDTEAFAVQGMYTAAIAGVMAVAILLVSTSFRLYTTWSQLHRKA